METATETARELALLENIELDPDITQVSLAAQMGVAVGTVNWHLKRLIEKGFIKIKRAERRKLRYLITPEGITLRARLTVDYVEQQFLLYHRTRERVSEYLNEVHHAGFDRVCIRGGGDVADICRLSCLDKGITVVNEGDVPMLEVNGLKVTLRLDGGLK